MYTKSLISKILHSISVRTAPWFCCVLCLALSACSSREPADTSRYERKAELLRLQILTDDVREAVGQAPAGGVPVGLRRHTKGQSVYGRRINSGCCLGGGG